MRNIFVFSFLILSVFIFPSKGFSMSSPTADETAIYTSDCGPDDAPVTNIRIADNAITNEFCSALMEGPRKPLGQEVFAVGDFGITVHSNAKLWNGAKIDGENLKKHVWADMCGINPRHSDPNRFELLSVQYLTESKELQLQYRLSGKVISRTLKLEQGEKQRDLVCG